MKKLLSLVIAMIIAMGLYSTPVFADVIAHPRGPVVITVDGEYSNFDAPRWVVNNPHSMMPIWATLLEISGARVGYLHTVSHTWITIESGSLPVRLYSVILWLLLFLLVTLLILMIFRKKFLPKK